jgi:enterochelin esterase family protein
MKKRKFNQVFEDFLVQYHNANENKKSTVIEEFIELQKNVNGFPIIKDNNTVVFVYFTKIREISSCEITGDFTGWNKKGISMTRLSSDVNFFYKQLSFEPTARLDYKFVLNKTEYILDPLNDQTVSGGFGPNSELTMPKFEQPKEIIQNPNIPHGKLINLSDIWSEPKVQIYLPPNYSPKLKYPTIYTSDGSEYITLGSAVTIIDNLIYENRIRPVITVFIDPKGDRIQWYNCNPEYLKFLDELVKYIDKNYSTKSSAHSRLHLGDSMGGLVSVYVALNRPSVFKLIGVHSGAFWRGRINYQIIERYAEADPSLNIKAWFSAGTYEKIIYQDTQAMVSLCRSKGWKTEALYLYEGHSWGTWRNTLKDMLEYFFSCN